MNYRSIIFGDESAARASASEAPRLYEVVDSTLKDYLDDLALCILEPLEIHKLNDGQYRVFVRSRLTEDKSKVIGVKFVELIQTLFTQEEASISRSKYLYFGNETTGEHGIFDAEDQLSFKPSSSPLSNWVEARTEPLRWNYATLDATPKAGIDEKFLRYRRSQAGLTDEFFSESQSNAVDGYLYNLLIPAAFQGAMKHSRSKRALGAIFLVLLIKRKIPQAVRELLFLRLSLFMYYYHSAEAIDKLIVESGMDRYQRILGMLEKPLSNLTTALTEVERDAQELRAVLFEPSRGLLAARHRIAVFFKEGEMLQTPNGGWVPIAHQPEQIRDPQHAQWTLAYLLASIRGDKPKIPSPQEALIFELVFFRNALQSNENPYQGLAQSLDRLLTDGLNGWCLDIQARTMNLDLLKNELASFKENLFQILKPDYQHSLTRNHIYTLLGIGQAPSSARDGAACVMPGLCDPFSSFAHLLEFLGMLAEQHPEFKSADGRAKFGVTIAGCTCNNQDSQSGRLNCSPIATISAPSIPWIDPGDQNPFYKDYSAVGADFTRMIADTSLQQSRELGQLGNFRGSFAYLFNRTNPKPDVCATVDALSCKWARFQIQFCGKNLILANHTKE